MAEFKLGRLRFVWKGTWTTGTAYVKDDIVRYGGVSYVCVEGHTANANFDVDLSADKWTVMTQGQEWKTNPWGTTTVYKIGDLVKYGGRVYIAKENHTSSGVAAGGFYDDLPNWDLFVDGFDWKYNWAVDTYYKVRDIVKYGGIAYVCTQGHTSAATPELGLEADGAKWQLFSEGFKWRNEWNGSADPLLRVATRYALNDVVKFGAGAYICISAHTSDFATFDETKWQPLVKGTEYQDTWAFSTEYQIGDIVKYGGNTYVATQRNTSAVPATSTGSWDLYIEGYADQGRYVPTTSYKIGDVVQYGGNYYRANEEVIAYESPWAEPTKWTAILQGVRWNNDWPTIQDSPDETFKVGDLTKYAATTYICIAEHVPADTTVITISQTQTGTNVITANDTSTLNPGQPVAFSGTPFANLTETTYYVKAVLSLTQFTISETKVNGVVGATKTLISGTGSMAGTYTNRPDEDQGDFWNVLAEGDANNVLVRRGDLVTRNAIQNVRLAKGQVGTFLKAGEQDLEWGVVGQINRVFYVSLDGDDNNDGTTLNSTWRTIKHACNYVLNSGLNTRDTPVVINVKTGVYVEEFPISIPKYTSLVGDELRMSIVEPTPETSGSDKFYMRDSTTMRNFTLRGATGANLPNGQTDTLTAPNQYLTRRPTGGAWVSLDPGTGPNDESVWVGERSPYMQNITLFGDYCVGQKTDGALHNGGNKSLTSNDFTTILSNGIGAWCTNQGRAELVSVFSYYGYIGYLCENGGVIRATNGNNSYGTYGSVSEGVDPTEISRTASVDNQRFEALIDRVQTDGANKVLYVEYLNAGEEYTTAEYNFTGSGVAGSVTAISQTQDGGVCEVRILSEGDNYLSVVNNAQAGTNIDIRLGAADIAPSGGYNGQRILIIDGLGAGQYAYITSFDGGTKLCTLGMESFTPLEVTGVTTGTNRLTVADASTLSVDMPFTLTGTEFGTLTQATQYYVKAITGNAFTVYTNVDTKAAITFPATTSGSMMLHKSGWDTIVSGITETITAASQTNPVEITTSVDHAIYTGMQVTISGVSGMTQLNGNTYFAVKTADNKFTLYVEDTLVTPVDGTGFSGYITGGTAVGTQFVPLFLNTTTRYTIEPRLIFSTGEGASATAVRSLGIDTIGVSTGGGGYSTPPAVIISGDGTESGGFGATATATILGGVDSIVIQSKGTGFVQAPTVRFVGGGLPPGGKYTDFVFSSTVVAGEYIRTSAGRHYEVIVGGILGASAPSHTTGTATNGTTTLLYLGTEATGTATITKTIKEVQVLNGGFGFTAPPSVAVSGTGGSGAVISAQISNVVGNVNMVQNGTNYTAAPEVSFVGGDPLEFATGRAILDAVVNSITMIEGGNGYDETTVVQLVGGGGVGAEAVAVIDDGNFEFGVTPGIITRIDIIDEGSGYSSAPDVVILGTGADAAATANLLGNVASVQVVTPGRGYQSIPGVSFSGGGGVGAQGTAVLTGSVISLTVVDGGRGWVGTPSLNITGGNGSSATAEVTLMDTVLDDITIDSAGDGYTSNPAVSITNGGLIYNEAKCERDVGLIIDAVTSDMVFNSNVASTYAGLSYLRSYSSVVIDDQKEQTIAGINKARELVLAETTNVTSIARLNTNFDIVVDIINNGVSSVPSLVYTDPSNTSAGVLQGVEVLIANRAFLQAELIAWINNEIADGAGSSGSVIWNGFTYDSATCSRDVGYIIDAFAYDLQYGGNWQTVNAAISYVTGATIPGQTLQTVAAYTYLKSVIIDVIQNNTVTPTTGNVVSQNTGLPDGSLDAANYVGDLVDIITDLITAGNVESAPEVVYPSFVNGTAGQSTVRATIQIAKPTIQAETINWISSTYSGAGAVVRSRIDGVIQTITVGDPGGQFSVAPLITFAGGGNLRSPQAGLRYYRSASGLVAIGEQSSQTLAGIEQMRKVARAVVLNTAPSPTYQSAVARVSGSGGYTPPTNIALIVDMWVHSVYYTIENGGEYSTSVNLLRANREFIRAEAMEFWAANFPGVANSTYSRDVGLMVDAIASDLETYGVLYTLTAAIKQVFTSARTVNISSVTQGIDFVKELALDIIQNNLVANPLTGLSVTATQVTTNYITVSDTATLSANDPITFTGIASGANFGNLTGGTQYYVKDVVNGTTITVSLTPGGNVVNLLSATGLITLSKQITDDTLALESGAITAVENNFNLIKENMSIVVGNSSAYATAMALLASNKTYIIAETISYINATYVDFDYNQVLCGRDVGFIVDAIRYDILNSLDNQPSTTSSTTGVISSITVDAGGVGYSSGLTISFTGVTPTLPATATAILNPLTGAITGFTMTNKGKGYASAPTVVLTPDPGTGAFARCKVVGSAVSSVTIINPGSGYLAGPHLTLIDPNNTVDASFLVRVADGVLDQPRFTERGVEYTTADGAVSGDGFSDIAQVGTFIYVKSLSNVPTPGANIQFDGNDNYYKLVTVREVQGPAGIIGARNLLTANKEFIQYEVIQYLNNFAYNKVKCERDVGIILQAIADGNALNTNLPLLSVIQSYQRGTYEIDLQRFQTAFGLQYLRDQIQTFFNGPSYTSSKYDLVHTSIDFLVEWIKNGEVFKPLPALTMTNGGYDTQDDNAKNILLANEDWLVQQTIRYMINNSQISGFDETIFRNDIRQMVRMTAYDLTYIGNQQTIQFGSSYWIDGTTLTIPGVPGTSASAKSEYLAMITYLQNLMEDVVVNSSVANEVGNTLTQNTLLAPGDGLSVARIVSLMGDFYSIVDLSPTVIGTPAVTNEATSFTAKDIDVKVAIEGQIATWKTAVTNWIDSNFVTFTYDNDICFRDVGLIVQAVADDIFGEVAKSIIAGQRYYAATAALVLSEQKPQTIAAINHIDYMIQKIIRNETYPRTQNVAFQEKQPTITNGAEASAQLAETIRIIRRIVEFGNQMDTTKQLLLDNKAFLQAEVVAYVSASYEDLNYDTTLCGRDVGLIVDAIAYDVYGGFSRSREAGLRYYSSDSALKAITGEQLSPTLDALNYLNIILQNVIADQDPQIRFQEALSRTRNPEVTAYIDSILLDQKIASCLDETITVINGGPTALPEGRYSARIQLSPPLSILTAPAHNTPIVLRSRYSQVRLTGHDFLNIGTGNKNDTNYPNVPLNNPDQNKEIVEQGGGRVFYTSTDQDGNFRVGELFKVEQSTGIATLNADAFNLSGLNELSLGGVNLGGTGATINEFSTDGTFFANSDSIVPTQKAIKTYIQSALGSGGGNIAVNAVTAGDTFITGKEIDTVGGGSLSLLSPDGVIISSTTGSVDPYTGALQVLGGVGIAQNLNIAGNIGVTGTLTVSSSGSVKIAAGTTSQRPVSPTAGMIRFNSETSSFEGYLGTQWGDIGGGGRPWAIKNSAYTAVNNDRLIVNTQAGPVTIALPLNPSFGDTVRFVDGAGTFDIYNLTVARNGSLIMGDAADLTVDAVNAGFALVYYNSTFGWRLVDA